MKRGLHGGGGRLGVRRSGRGRASFASRCRRRPRAGVRCIRLCSGLFTPERPTRSFTVGDLAGYAPADPTGPDTTLTLRTPRSAGRRSCRARRGRCRATPSRPPARHSRPERIYELTYRASSAPYRRPRIRGGARRRRVDQHDSGALARAKYMYAFGSSQSGRFLRTFLYQGFNTDVQGRQVFDGVMAHIAGAARLDLNRRGATPTTLGGFSATAFPFAESAQRDPVSGVTEGAARQRARAPESAEDLLHQHRRRVLGRRTVRRADSHEPGRNARCRARPRTRAPTSSPARSTVQALSLRRRGWGSRRGTRPITGGRCARCSWRWTGGCREGVAPPANRIPRLADGTLVASEVGRLPGHPRRAVAGDADAGHADRERLDSGRRRCRHAAAAARAAGRCRRQRARGHSDAGRGRPVGHLYRVELPAAVNRCARAHRPIARLVRPASADACRA